MRKLAATRSRRATLLGAAIGMCAVMLTAGAGVAAARTYDDPGQGNNGDDLGGVGLVLMVPGQTVRVHVDALTGTAASVPGVDSGVALLPGQLARVTATGTASCSPSVSLATSVGCLNTDADGAAATAGSGFLAPGQPKYSLVGEVGSGP
ncbi:MAG: hypothetical protein ACRDS0_37445, partial [Pseudonocardiaceae bacterium]